MTTSIEKLNGNHDRFCFLRAIDVPTKKAAEIAGISYSRVRTLLTQSIIQNKIKEYKEMIDKPLMDNYNDALEIISRSMTKAAQHIEKMIDAGKMDAITAKVCVETLHMGMNKARETEGETSETPHLYLEIKEPANPDDFKVYTEKVEA